mmetsp:Transcript_10913/g.12465  ORF Transcript_10913/g.12465 Transcript_10913/m.12465 type:complete len:499 (+) Transcript_10913:480-1976(+)
MEAVKNESIYIPSTFRLLRLVNGIVCERLEECCSYNLVLKKYARLDNTGNLPFGLHICNGCARSFSVPLLSSFRWQFLKPQVCNYDHNRVVSQPFFERNTYNPIGPMIQVKHIKQIEASRFSWAMIKDKNEPKDFFEHIVGRMDFKNDKDKNRRQIFLTAFEQAIREYPSFEKAKIDIKLRKLKEKEDKRVFRKLKNARLVYSKIKRLLNGHKYVDIALSCIWDKKTGICRFNFGISQDILGSLLSAPTSATKKIISCQVDQLQEAYDLLEEKGYLGPYSYFRTISPWASTVSQDCINIFTDFESAIFQYCRHHRSCINLLKSFHADLSFIELVRDGKTAKALTRVLGKNDYKNAFVNYIILGRGFQFKRMTCCDLCKKKKLNYRIHAEEIWDSACLSSPKRKFEACQHIFQGTMDLIARYRRQPLVQAFLKETDPPMIGGFCRGAVIDTLYDGLFLNLYIAEDVSMLLDIHREMFEHPFRFDINPYEGDEDKDNSNQ